MNISSVTPSGVVPKMISPRREPSICVPQRQLNWLRLSFWVVALFLGFLAAWNERHSWGIDGVSYLDLGDQFFAKGPWKTLNPYWSPLYPFLLGTANHLLRPSYFWEFPLAHAVNWIIFAVSLACFDFFLLELIRYHRQRRPALGEAGMTTFPDWCWLALGYALFIWTSIEI